MSNTTFATFPSTSFALLVTVELPLLNSNLSEIEKSIICDPQTSGGLLVSVSNEGLEEFYDLMRTNALDLKPIGKILDHSDENTTIVIK